MGKSGKRGNKQGRPKRAEDEEDNDDDDDYNSRKDNDDVNDDDDDDDDNDDDKDHDDNNNNNNEDAIGKGSNPRKIKKKTKDEYNVDMSFGHGRDWTQKYNKLRDLCQEYKRDNILLRAELRTAKGSRETTKRVG